MSKLYGEDGYAIETVVSKADINTLIPVVKEAGATWASTAGPIGKTDPRSSPPWTSSDHRKSSVTWLGRGPRCRRRKPAPPPLGSTSRTASAHHRRGHRSRLRHDPRPPRPLGSRPNPPPLTKRWHVSAPYWCSHPCQRSGVAGSRHKIRRCVTTPMGSLPTSPGTSSDLCLSNKQWRVALACGSCSAGATVASSRRCGDLCFGSRAYRRVGSNLHSRHRWRAAPTRSCRTLPVAGVGRGRATQACSSRSVSHVGVRPTSRTCATHRSVVLAIDRRTARGIPVTSPERTIIDLSGRLDASQLGRLADDGIRRRLMTADSLAVCVPVSAPGARATNVGCLSGARAALTRLRAWR